MRVGQLNYVKYKQWHSKGRVSACYDCILTHEGGVDSSFALAGRNLNSSPLQFYIYYTL